MTHVTGPASIRSPAAWGRRSLADLALFAGIGVIAAFLGPFGSAAQPLGFRLAYWIACLVGGGLVGVLVDEAVRRLVSRFWPRLVATSLAMTPPVGAVVSGINFAAYRQALPIAVLPAFLFQVFVVSFAAMALRQLAWAQPAPPAAAVPDASVDPLATFRRRLSAKRRQAAIYAVEAEDHYLRVHTDAGDELITARFGDALKELAGAPGFQTHRSWWVAAEAIDTVRWLRGRGEARLKCGLVVPVSRSNAAALKAAGWF
jgi:DNA-binding LytR/AlgR family response regulator